ncbi:hypothetical protein D3C72_1343300 [compost metagenome]
MKRTLQTEQGQAVASGQAQIEQQRVLSALLHHLRHVGREQGTVGIALYAIEDGQAAQVRIRRHLRQAFAQAPYQARDLAGARAIGDEIPGTGTHGIEHKLVVHAVAERDDRQHRLGFQRAFDQCALGHHMVAVQADEHQAGEGHVDQREQFIEAAATGADHLTQRREGALQPFEVGVVTRDCEEGLIQVLAHCDNPLRLSMSPFSRRLNNGVERLRMERRPCSAQGVCWVISLPRMTSTLGLRGALPLLTGADFGGGAVMASWLNCRSSRLALASVVAETRSPAQ